MPFEIPLDVDEGLWKAHTMLMGDEPGVAYVVDVSTVNTDSASSQHWRGNFGAAKAALWACDAAKLALSIARQIQNDGTGASS